MAAVSGQYGTVHIGSSELLEVNFWSMSRKTNVHQYATNNTSGHKKTVAGTKSGSGTIRGVYDPDDPPDDHFVDGDDVTLKLYTTAAKYIEADSTIENLDYEVEIDEGEVVGWEAGFVTDGAWVLTNLQS